MRNSVVAWILAILLALGLGLGAFALWRHNAAESERKLQELRQQLTEAQERESGGPRDPGSTPAATGGAPNQQGPTDFPFEKPEEPAPLRDVTPPMPPP